MKELIKYLAGILNIKTDSDLVILDITNELEGIADIVDYQKFIRDNFDYLGLEHKTGFQKFIILTKMYKRRYAELTNTDRLSKSYKCALELSEKVKAVANTVLDRPYLESRHFIKDGEPIFTQFEQKQLSKIGSLLTCINLQRSTSGEDALLVRLEKQMSDVVINQALGYKQSERTAHSVSSLIGGAVQKIKA